MEAYLAVMEKLINESKFQNRVFKRNVLKDYLQILVLDFIYSSKKYKDLVFYGGSCLAHCFSLPRLSEDLDFVDIAKLTDLNVLAKDIALFVKKELGIDIKTSVQKFRIYLKFPLLRDLGLAGKSESDLLFLKIEVFKDFEYCTKCNTEITPLFKFNRSILVRTFDISTLMATKINAVLRRVWIKKDKTGREVVRVKGRDYFDLMWYLEKGIKPNIDCIIGIDDMVALKKKLLENVAKLDKDSIKIDLEPLIEDATFVDNFSCNIKEILKRQILSL
ncbi:MAG: nucleotidyl transferase AbiEii/AbiGii toxin family protein [bacterium]